MRKLRPGIQPRNGINFPNGAACGNCVPESCLRMGCTFRNSRKPETASQFERLFRDAVSAGRFNRKVCPILGLDSGTRFPLGMPSGKYIPF